MKSIRKRTVLVSALIIWIQIAFVPFVAVKGAVPDLMFLLIAFYAFSVDYRDVLWVSFFLGLCRDFLTNSFFGLETASFVIGALLLQYAVAQFNRRDTFIVLLSVFLFSFAALTSPMLMLAIDGETNRIVTAFPRILMISFYTSILAIGIFPVFRRLFGLSSSKVQHELF